MITAELLISSKLYEIFFLHYDFNDLVCNYIPLNHYGYINQNKQCKDPNIACAILLKNCKRSIVII